MRRALVFALVALVLAAPAAAERFRWYAGTAGVVKADLDDLTLLDTSTTPATVLADPGITLTAIGGLCYEVGGLPDAVPGSGDSYGIVFSYLGIPYSTEWPTVAQTVQPQAVSYQVAWTPTRTLLELGAGDLLPLAEANVSGLAASPSGATVTFTLVNDAGEAVIIGAAAELANFASYLGTDGETRWRALLRYRWADGDTDDAGDYTYSFRITFPGSPPRPLTIPPPRSFPARIYE